MADPRPVTPLLLVIASFSRHPEVIAWSAERLETLFGPIGFVSLPYDFVQTRYYEASMGAGLKKCFFACRQMLDPDQLADVKLRTNALETEAAAKWNFPEPRPLNLDPGLLSLGKFMLATTKDQAHRIYLRNGIFAEVTLHFYAALTSFGPGLMPITSFLKCVRSWAQRDYYRMLLAELPRLTPEAR